MSKHDPVRYANGVVVYPPKPKAQRQQHRVVYRGRDGARITRWRTDAGDAHRTALEVASELERVAALDSGDHGHRTVIELAAAWRETKGDEWEPSTAEGAEQRLRLHVLPTIGDRRCDSLTADDIQQLLKKASTDVPGIYRTLRGMLGFAVDSGWLPQGDIMVGVHRPRRGRQSREGAAPIVADEVPSQTAVEALASAAGESFGAPWRALEVRVAAYCGVRLGELHALTCDDVDFDAGLIRVDRQLTTLRSGRHLHLPKGRKRRVTFIPGFLDGALAEHVELMRSLDRAPGPHPCRPCSSAIVEGDGPLLFPSARGLWPQRRWWTEQHVDPWREAAGWPKDADGRYRWSWHDLRHHFCSWALANPGGSVDSGIGPIPDGLGLEVADVALFAGHASPDFTWRVYVSPREGATERARRASSGD